MNHNGFLAVLVCALILLIPTLCYDCQPGYEPGYGTMHCYKYFTPHGGAAGGHLTWQAASKQCEDEGAYLPSITTQEENDWYAALLEGADVSISLLIQKY